MHPIRSSVAVLAALALFLAALTPAVIAQEDEAEHPFVGAWVLDATPDDPTDPVDLFVVNPGGTLVSLGAEGLAAGSWLVTGERSADVTFHGLVVLPDGGFGGLMTVRASGEVAEDGQSFTATYTFEPPAAMAEMVGAPVGQLGPSEVTAQRIDVEPMGETVGPIPDVETSPAPQSSAIPQSVPASPSPSATDVPSPLVPAKTTRSVVATKLPGASAVAAGHGRYVAVGTGGASPKRPVAWVSSDGVTWDRASIAEAGPGSHMVAVTPTSDGFVGLGYARELDGARSSRILAWYSSDGMAWERASVQRPALRGFDAFPQGLADGPAGQLALGRFSGQDLAGQRLWHSADGQTWEPTALPDVEGANWYTVVAVPGGYLLLGESGPPSGDLSEWKASNWRSADGVTWEELGELPSSTLAAAPDGTVVAIGGTDIWRSSDLLEWEMVWTVPAEWASRSEDSAFQRRYGPRAMFGWVDWAGDRFMLTGRDYGACPPRTDGYGEECMRYPLLQSADGRDWSQVNGPDGSVGLDSDIWLEDVASDGVSTVLLDVSGDGPPVVWRIVNEPLSTAAIE